MTLQSKVDTYQIEIEQLKKALKRSDEYIEKLTLELQDTHKQFDICLTSPTFGIPPSNNPRTSPGNEMNGGSKRPNTLSTLDKNNNNNNNSSSRLPDFNHKTLTTKNTDFIEKSTPSASSILQRLVRENGNNTQSNRQQQPRREESIEGHFSGIWNPTQAVRSPCKTLPSNNILGSPMKLQRHSNPKQHNRYDEAHKGSEDVVNSDPKQNASRNISPVATSSDHDVISNPLRFPASLKLLELSKQHDESPSPLQTSTSHPSESPSSSPDKLTIASIRRSPTSPNVRSLHQIPSPSSALKRYSPSTMIHDLTTSNNNHSSPPSCYSPRPSQALQSPRQSQQVSLYSPLLNRRPGAFTPSPSCTTGTSVNNKQQQQQQQQQQHDPLIDVDNDDNCDGAINTEESQITIVMPSDEQPSSPWMHYHQKNMASPTNTAAKQQSNEGFSSSPQQVVDSRQAIVGNLIPSPPTSSSSWSNTALLSPSDNNDNRFYNAVETDRKLSSPYVDYGSTVNHSERGFHPPLLKKVKTEVFYE